MDKDCVILLFRGNRKDLHDKILEAFNKEIEFDVDMNDIEKEELASKSAEGEIEKLIKENFIDCEIEI